MSLPREGTMTSWKTSHGPAKSITVTPSEMAAATGILPFAGGVSLLPAGVFANPIKLPRVNTSGTEAAAMATPSAAVFVTKSLLFIASAPCQDLVCCPYFTAQITQVSASGMRLCSQLQLAYGEWRMSGVSAVRCIAQTILWDCGRPPPPTARNANNAVD